MNRPSKSLFWIGYPAALDLAFGRAFTEFVTVWTLRAAQRPSRNELMRLVPSITEDTPLHFEVGREPSFELSADCLLVDAMGQIWDACRMSLISRPDTRRFELASLSPLPSIGAALRADAVLLRYPHLPVADEFRAWIRATNVYVNRLSSQFPEIALARLRANFFGASE